MAGVSVAVPIGLPGPAQPAALLETDIRDKVLKRAFCAAARVVAEQDFKDDGYLCVLWRVQLSKIFLAPPCRARLVRYVPLPHKIKLGAKRHWVMGCENSVIMGQCRLVCCWKRI